jgi:hypothetical protein
MSDGGIDDGALAQRQAFFLQITADDRRGQLMLFQQVLEVHDRGVFRYRGAQGQACKLAHGRDFVERFFHGRVAQGEPVLQQMNAQHGFQRIRFSAAAGLGVERLDQAPQACPGHNLIHLGEEAFAAGLLALAGIFEIGKAHLAHGQFRSGGQAYFITSGDLFGNSLGLWEGRQENLRGHPILFNCHREGLFRSCVRSNCSLGHHCSVLEHAGWNY